LCGTEAEPDKLNFDGKNRAVAPDRGGPSRSANQNPAQYEFDQARSEILAQDWIGHGPTVHPS